MTEQTRPPRKGVTITVGPETIKIMELLATLSRFPGFTGKLPHAAFVTDALRFFILSCKDHLPPGTLDGGQGVKT